MVVSTATAATWPTIYKVTFLNFIIQSLYKQCSINFAL